MDFPFGLARQFRPVGYSGFSASMVDKNVPIIRRPLYYDELGGA